MSCLTRPRPMQVVAAATLAAAGCGLAPATAPAQGPGGFGPSTELIFKGPKVRGFKLSGSTQKFGDHVFFSRADLTRRTPGATETHTREFRRTDGGPDELPELTLNSSRSKGTLKASLRGLDALSLKFTATRKAKRSAMPKNLGPFINCTGPDGTSRKGVLKGKLTFSAGAYFNTISVRRLKATVIDLPAPSSCSPLNGGVSVPTIRAESSSGASYAVKRLPNGKTSHSLSGRESPMVRNITSTGDGSAFTYTADAATATVRGVGPLLSGTLNYTASTPPSNSSPYSFGNPFESGGRFAGSVTGEFVTGKVRVVNGFGSLKLPRSR